MKQFVNRVSNERGVTLVELMATITIISIIGGSMYGLLGLGLRTYESINIEARLRDEADYVVTMIMNELYSSDYDDVRYDANQQSLQFFKRKSEMPVLQNDDLRYVYTNNPIPSAQLFIADGEVVFEKMDAEGKVIKHITFRTDTDIQIRADSQLNMLCTSKSTVFTYIQNEVTPVTLCSNGIVELQFIFKAANERIKPLNVKSEIGF
ncbi:prepilin-type N-terminal cleavage/methylation domain-containing protein [Ectobacillus sp. JY-23]|uniref:prepilin-type N-terminal cleavage/methylation domain-containing protein n=1 Tax=Ectobacillus sp. JY-23 TaxID=2933872 RepID=UPI001FF58EC4|nr:prepilin-type N-terminal cleavage/methylation domain-containing protein [Ectobacillus sp. JY-23]UOY92618.1 prepilin-type N-terminal cleavage/methylation domain-containing protein [Ectobacillus sp. JY-23]